MRTRLPITASLIAVLMGSTVALAQQEKGQPQIEQKGGADKAGPAAGGAERSAAPAAADKADKGGAAPRAQSEPRDGAQGRTAQPGPGADQGRQDQRGAPKAKTAEPQKSDQQKAEPKRAEPKSAEPKDAEKRADRKSTESKDAEKRAEPKAGTDGKSDGKARADDQKSKADRNGRERTPGQDDKRQAGDQPKSQPGKSGDARTGQSKSDRERFGYRPDESKTGQPQRRPDGTSKSAEQPRDADRNLANEPAARVQVTTEQRSRIRQAIDVRRAQKVRRVDFNISIGTPVPRHVRFRPLPQSIITIVPEYRGYDYFVVQERICIVQPRTRVIVAVIDDTDTSGPARTSSLILTPEERLLILGAVDRERDRASVSIRPVQGAGIPASVELHVFPERVVERVPRLKAYRYVVIDREVVLVDPASRSVALIVEQ